MSEAEALLQLSAYSELKLPFCKKIKQVSMLFLKELYLHQGNSEMADAISKKWMATAENDLIGRTFINLSQGWKEMIETKSYGNEDAYLKVISTLKRDFGEKSIPVIINNCLLAVYYKNHERWEEAEKLLLRYICISEESSNECTLFLILQYVCLWECYSEQNRTGEAEKIIMKAIVLLHQQAQVTVLHAWIYDKLGRTLHKLKKLQEAKAVFMKAIAILESTLGYGYPNDCLEPYSALADVYIEEQKWLEAELIYAQYIEILEKTNKENSAEYALIYVHLFFVYQCQDKIAEVEIALLKAIHLFVKLFGEEHLILPRLLDQLADNYQLKGQFLEAEQVYKVCIEKFKKLRESRLLLYALEKLFQIYMHEKRFMDAEIIALEAIDLMQKNPITPLVTLATVYESLAYIYSVQKRYEEAQTMYCAIFAMLDKAPGEGTTVLIDSYRGLGLILTAFKKFAEGEELLVKALRLVREKQSTRQDKIEFLEEILAWNYKQQERQRIASRK